MTLLGENWASPKSLQYVFGRLEKTISNQLPSYIRQRTLGPTKYLLGTSTLRRAKLLQLELNCPVQLQLCCGTGCDLPRARKPRDEESSILQRQDSGRSLETSGVFHSNSTMDLPPFLNNSHVKTSPPPIGPI